MFEYVSLKPSKKLLLAIDDSCLRDNFGNLAVEVTRRDGWTIPLDTPNDKHGQTFIPTKIVGGIHGARLQGSGFDYDRWVPFGDLSLAPRFVQFEGGALAQVKGTKKLQDGSMALKAVRLEGRAAERAAEEIAADHARVDRLRSVRAASAQLENG